MDNSSNGGWKAAILIIFVEVADRFAYYGLVGNIIMYFTNQLHQPLATAAKNINIWMGVSCIFPLIGGFVADSYLGRFKPIVISSIIYLLGMILLTLSVSKVPLSDHEAVFFIALYVLAIGEGGHKPCVQTFAADQFDEESPQEKKTKSSFFNWWYLGIVIGATSGALVGPYVQDHAGWTVGVGTLAAVIGAALILFLAGIKTYRMQAPVGSPFTRVVQVFVAAAHKRRVDEMREGKGICLEEDVECKRGHYGMQTLARTEQFRFLDKAMIIDSKDASNNTRNPWNLCSLNQVEEVKLILRLIPIWLSCLMYMVVLSCVHSFFTKQGSIMDRSIGPHFQISPAQLQGFTGITILVVVPIYDRIFMPIARKFTKHPNGISVLQRIGIGLLVSILEVVVAALVETKRVNVAKQHGLIDNPKAIIPMAVWWMVPQYMLSGIGDVFTIVGLQELFYDQMPETLRSLGAAAYVSILGMGNFAGTAIIAIVQAISSKAGDEWLVDNLNRSHLDHFYWVLAGLSALNLCVYIWTARAFVYKKVQDDEGRDMTLDSNVKV